jgi:predicted AlkP superfamily pyrophosphatase or phosphodiesterase
VIRDKAQERYRVEKSLLAGLALACAAPAFAEQPKLIVAIAVDQFSADLFSEYRSIYSGGLKRLSGGVVFPRGHQSHAATETCPGHSTILTGSRPARTGIIANDWQMPSLERKDASGKPTHDVYCAEAPGPAGSNAAARLISAQFLRVPTLGDRMKIATPASRVLSVSGKDRAAVMMGGHAADVTLWWNGKAFGTYAGRETSIPIGVAVINARATAAIAKPITPKLPPQCAARSRAVPVSATAAVGTLMSRKAGNEPGWRATPEFDAMTLDVALTSMSALQLGKGAATDLLAISFSATDYTGHAYGTEGAEMCAQIRALDATLGRLFAALDKTGVPYAVTLTADHGGHDLPERNAIHALPAAQRVDSALSATAVGAAIAKQLGLAENALLGRATFGDMYISASVPAEKRAAVRDAAAAFYRAHPQVAATFTKDELIAAPAPSGPVDEWTLIERAKASFDPERSGDLIVLLKPYVTPIPDVGIGYVATHGSPWNYDRRVPILFWWKGISGFEQPNAVETVDIMPTLASLIGLPVPASEIDGRCLDLMAGPESNCR